MKYLSCLLFLSLNVTAEVPKADLDQIKLSTLCASLLDRQDELGALVEPAEMQLALASPISRLVEGMQASNETLPRERFIQKLAADLEFSLAQSAKDGTSFEVEDATTPAASLMKVRGRRALKTLLTKLQADVAKVPGQLAPLRRVLRGRDQVVRAIDNLIEDARVNEARAKADFLRTQTELKDNLETTTQEFARMRTELRDKSAREAGESWRAKYFGPSSDMPKLQRSAWLAGYTGLGLGSTLLASFVSPALIPVSVVAFGAGWVGVRQHLYYAVDQVKVMVRGMWAKHGVQRQLSRHELLERAAIRATTELANLNDLKALALRTDAPNAIAFYGSTIHFAERSKLGFGKDPVLNGESLRLAATQNDERSIKARKVNLDMVLSFDRVTGEPELISTMIERKNERWRDLAFGAAILFIFAG